MPLTQVHSTLLLRTVACSRICLRITLSALVCSGACVSSCPFSRAFRWGEVGALCTAGPVFASYALFDRANQAPFQLFAVVVATAAACGLLFAASLFERTETALPRATLQSVSLCALPVAARAQSCAPSPDGQSCELSERPAVVLATVSELEVAAASSSAAAPALREFLLQLLKHDSFWAFVAVNFLQVAHVLV